MSLDVKPLVLPALTAYRAAAALRRAEAFCDAPETVLGFPVLPLTPRTYSMLFATQSHFVHGGEATEQDVKLWLWFHSPLWCHAGEPGYLRRYHRALAPFNAALKGRWSILGRSLRHRGVVIAQAVDAIETILAADFADAPADSGAPGRPVATLEAQFIHQMATAYGWEPARTRHTPLRQLFQLDRLITLSRGGTVEDAGEERIKEQHYQRRNAAALAAAAGQKPEASA